MDTFFLYWKLILIHGCCHVTFLVIILLLRAKCFTNTSLSTQPQMKCFSLENRTEPRHHLVVSCSDSVQFLLMGQWEQFRAAWRPAVLAIAAPGPIAGRAWHFCCSPRFVPESGGVEPADSARPAAAPYSSAGRNRRRPRLECREPKLLNTNLLGHKQQYANVDENHAALWAEDQYMWWGGVSGEQTVTCLPLSVWLEPSHCHLTAGCQQHGTTFVHDCSVGQNRLDGFMQHIQSLLRNPQHQLQKRETTNAINKPCGGFLHKRKLVFAQLSEVSFNAAADLSEGQVKDGFRGQWLEVVLSSQSQGLQEDRKSCGEARRLPVELSSGQHHSERDIKWLCVISEA